MKYTLEYSSNNSGGSWWLNDEDWRALEKAGWDVDWVINSKDEEYYMGDKSGRFLDALATHASIQTDDPKASVKAFQEITGAVPSDEGCNCCGPPHNFSVENNENGDYLYLDYDYAVVRSSFDELD